MRLKTILCLVVIVVDLQFLVADEESNPLEDLEKDEESSKSEYDAIFRHFQVNKNESQENPIPNEVPVPSFNISSPVKGSFSDIKLFGLQGISIEDFSTDFVEMEVNVAISFPNLTLNGKYAMEVGALFWKKSYSGPFSMNAENLTATAFAYLNVTNTSLVVGDVDIDLSVNKTNVKFENLISNSEFMKSIINNVGNMIFQTANKEACRRIKEVVKQKLDKELSKLPYHPQSGRSHQDNDPIDFLLKAVALRMKTDGLDPLHIKFIRHAFQKKIAFFTVKGEVKIGNGVLEGLSTIHRTGDIKLDFHENEMILDVNLGVDVLRGKAIWGVHVMKYRQYGSVRFTIMKVALSVKMKQEMVKGAHPRLIKFKITSLDHIWIDLEGLGMLDSVAEYSMNMLTNAFKSELIKSIEVNVKKELQEEMNKITLPFDNSGGD